MPTDLKRKGRSSAGRICHRDATRDDFDFLVAIKLLSGGPRLDVTAAARHFTDVGGEFEALPEIRQGGITCHFAMCENLRWILHSLHFGWFERKKMAADAKVSIVTAAQKAIQKKNMFLCNLSRMESMFIFWFQIFEDE